MTRIDYGEAVTILKARLEEASQQLRQTGGSKEALKTKLELEAALQWLELGVRYQIPPNSRVTVIPQPSTQTPASEFRLIEDNESEDRARWLEVRAQDEPVRPLPGSILLEPRGSR